MTKKFLLGISTFFVVFLAATTAQATQYNGTVTYFVQYHFSAEAFGKPVKAVRVHTGVLNVWCGQESWADTKDIDMTFDGQRFNARAVVRGDVHSGCGGARGAVAQYFVEFTDGSTLVTNPGLVNSRWLGNFDQIRESQEATDAIENATEALKSAPAVDATRADAIQVGYAS